MKDFFDQNEVLRVLQAHNPWWADGRELEIPEFKRVAFGVCQKYLNESMKRAILLAGPRRVGKTTILQQIAQDLIRNGRNPKSIFYISLDHPLLKLLTLPEILDLYHREYYPQGKQAILLLDEVHYSREWDLYVKNLIDHSPQYRIIATGSASISHQKKIVESGAGRWIKILIPTLSFFEFVHISKEPIPRLDKEDLLYGLFSKGKGELLSFAQKFRDLMPSFRRYLLVGGFPETAVAQKTSISQKLLREDVVERVLKRDMTALFGVRNVNELEKLFIYLCLNSGGILSIRTCAAALETTATTVSNHLQLLEDANLIYRLPPSNVGGKKILKARYKVYLADAALRNAVLLRGEEVLSNPKELGEIIETTVLRHVYAYYYEDTPRLAYWRDATTEKEVDMIVKSPNMTLPIEVKYRENATIEDDGGLATFCRLEKVPRAYLVTLREQDFDLCQIKGANAKILRIPAHIFTFLLGKGEHQAWRK